MIKLFIALSVGTAAFGYNKTIVRMDLSPNVIAGPQVAVPEGVIVPLELGFMKRSYLIPHGSDVIVSWHGVKHNKG